MPSHSEERRQAVVAQLLPPHNLSVREVAEQLQRWRHDCEQAASLSRGQQQR